jgi:hypothetical protein
VGGEQSSRATSLTLTFLFTDIESHAEKWDVHPAEMSGALRDHDALVVAAVSRAHGRVVKNEGESWPCSWTPRGLWRRRSRSSGPWRHVSGRESGGCVCEWASTRVSPKPATTTTSDRR